MGTVVFIARIFIGVVGGLILLMTIVNLLSGNSLTDPVFPGGLALGATMIGAAAWARSPGATQAIVVWLGVAAVLITTTIFGAMTFGTNDPKVYPVFLVPAAIFLSAMGAIAAERVRAGILGSPPAQA